MELKGSKTEQNLLTAFAGESQARGKYTYYAQKAREEGMEQIARFFEETARNEQEHANVVKSHGDQIPTTAENLEMRCGLKTTSGQTCTNIWQKQLVRKVS